MPCEYCKKVKAPQKMYLDIHQGLTKEKKIGPQGVLVWLTRVVQVELLQLIFFIDDLVLVMNCIECCKKFFLYKYKEIFTTV